MTTEAEAATHARRAAAIYVHHSRRDSAGLNAVFAELEDGEDATNLLMALLCMFEEIVPAILQPTAAAMIGRLVVRFAEREDEQ